MTCDICKDEENTATVNGVCGRCNNRMNADDDKLSLMFRRNSEFTDRSMAQGRKNTIDKIYEQLIEENISISYEVRELLEQEREEKQWAQLIIAMMDEVTEIANETPWKWWKRNNEEINKDKGTEECVDLLHFLLQAFEKFRAMPKDIYRHYMRKNDINHERLDKLAKRGKR